MYTGTDVTVMYTGRCYSCHGKSDLTCDWFVFYRSYATVVHSRGSSPEVVPQASTSQLPRSPKERTRLSLVTAQVIPSQ